MQKQLVALLTLSLVFLGTVRAADVPTIGKKSTTVKDLVRQALHAEMNGKSTDRRAAVEQALKNAPGDAAARWLDGQVRVGKEWKSYADAAATGKKSSLLEEYRSLRDESEPTIASQVNLGRFCKKQGLKEQAVAHWSAVLELDPTHAEAAQQLNFVLIDGHWQSPDEIIAARQAATLVAVTLRKLTPTLKAISKDLESGELNSAAAAERLAEHSSPAAIPAWESLVSTPRAAGASAVVIALAKMTDPEASLALARHALSARWPEVRKEAAAVLKERDPQSFVPALLAEMRGPWIGWHEMATDRRNRIVYRYALLADGQDQQTLKVLDDAYFLRGDRSVAAGTASLSAGFTAVNLEAQRRAENALIEEHNLRVMDLLAEVTGKIEFDSPQRWWLWWDERNEVYSSSDKPIDASYAFRTASIVGQPPAPPAGGGRPASRRDDAKKDCLAGGTKIMTQRGLVAVERVRIGDLVLAQHPDTGEIAFKAVLRTTIREPEYLLCISLGGETLRASGGHPFWVAGQGWLRARELKPGMRLHGLGTFTEVTDVQVEDKAVRSFNLIVSDFHSYFVGPGQTLSHDNSAIEAVRVKVPGLSE